jgi:predicted PurR-regulated permease PerM
VTASAIPFASSVVQSLLAGATNLVYVVIIPILSFLILKDGPLMGRMGLRWFSPAKREWIAKVGAEVHDVLGQYVRALGQLSLATFTVYSGFFIIVGVPFGLLLAALAALLEFIPVVGPLTAAGLALLVALMAGYQNLLWLTTFFIAYRIFQDYILAPRLMSSGVGLSPALVIFGFLAGEQLAGIPGMFLAIPILATLRIVLSSIESRSNTTLS